MPTTLGRRCLDPDPVFLGPDPEPLGIRAERLLDRATPERELQPQRLANSKPWSSTLPGSASALGSALSRAAK
jgi:hypothetical protein